MSRSVEAVVADMVQTVRRKTYGDANGFSAPQLERQREQILESLTWSRVPALVEALAEIAETDLSGIADKPSVGDELDETLVGIVRGYQSMARAALGGEQVQGRAELEARVGELQGAVDRAATAMHDSEYVGGPSERDAWRTAISELEAVATQHQGMDPDTARESLSPTPTTPKGSD